MNVKEFAILYAPWIAAALILIGLTAWIGYSMYGSRRKMKFVFKDEYAEAFVYVVLLGVVLWILKVSGSWSNSLIKELYR